MYNKITAFIVFGIMFFSQMTVFAIDKSLEGTITKISGKVVVQRYKSTTWDTAEPNMPIKQGDTVVTNIDSEAEIIFDDGTMLRLEQKTAILIEESAVDQKLGRKKVDVFIKGGKLLNNLEKLIRRDSKYRVRTPTAVIGVRGTQFSAEVSTNNAQTKLAVYGGTVAVQSSQLQGPGEEVAVGTEKETVVDAGKSPSQPSDFSDETKNYYLSRVVEFEKRVEENRKRLEEIIKAKQEYIEQKMKNSQKKIDDKIKKFEELQKKMQQNTEE